MTSMAKQETAIVTACLDLLHMLKIPAWRNNSGAVALGSGPSRRCVRYGHPGSPDIIGVIPRGIRAGTFLGVECKTEKGRQSDSQKEFQRTIEAAHGVYVLARSVSDLHERLKFFPGVLAAA